MKTKRNYELLHHMKRIEDIDQGRMPQFEKSFLFTLREESKRIIDFITRTNGEYQKTDWMDEKYIKELDEYAIQNDL